MMHEGKRIKICSKCGKSFECSHSKECWCNEYQISEKNLKLLRETFRDCLCPDCLLEYAENSSEIIDN
ncbi:MAG: cysteine-rich CWC family protein [Bacteroidales bacterium]|nr:cysteine-rich CWC family protein [Bacteroidales bacterium]MCF8386438.1 cysteine-rich CWC family protein [Bacteroidales bacterium]MCF8397818.1 cysteine-rich CWC family protein [Bacteroidales bacterium]